MSSCLESSGNAHSARPVRAGRLLCPASVQFPAHPAQQHLRAKVIYDLRSDIYQRLQTLPLRWFDNRPSGDIMTTVSEDIPAVERVLIDGIEQGLVSVLQIVVVGAFMFRRTPRSRSTR
jgi:ABC-type multidrug transport system fused ATPase/permease subunit